MMTGQKVRVKPSSPIARDWQLPPDHAGTVICSYSLLTKRGGGREWLDVQIRRGLIVWASAAENYELIVEGASPAAPV